MNLVTEHAPDGGNAPEDGSVKAPEKPVETPATADPDYAKYLEWKKQQEALAAAQAKANAPAEYYVWLADGDVVKVKADDFPVSLTVDHLGHYEKNGHSYRVVAVYPVEEKVG